MWSLLNKLDDLGVPQLYNGERISWLLLFTVCCNMCLWRSSSLFYWVSSLHCFSFSFSSFDFILPITTFLFVDLENYIKSFNILRETNIYSFTAINKLSTWLLKLVGTLLNGRYSDSLRVHLITPNRTVIRFTYRRKKTSYITPRKFTTSSRCKHVCSKGNKNFVT